MAVVRRSRIRDEDGKGQNLTANTRGRLFVVDGIISLPIAFAGFFLLPDVPEIAKPFYMSKQAGTTLTFHRELAC